MDLLDYDCYGRDIKPLLSIRELGHNLSYVAEAIQSVSWGKRRIGRINATSIDVVWQRSSIMNKACCLRCNLLLSRWDVDQWRVSHVIPPRYGGSDDVLNLVLLCNQCHNHKGDTLPVTLREWDRHLSKPRGKVYNMIAIMLVMYLGIALMLIRLM